MKGRALSATLLP